jgi:alkylhydroperoxidase family enzyme
MRPSCVGVMPRVPRVDPASLPDDYEILAEEADALNPDITAEWWNSQSTVQTFGNNADLAETHVNTNVSMWTQTNLTPQEVEYVILAVARELDSAYEWHDHAIAAVERAGIDEEAIIAIADKETDTLSEKIRVLVNYTYEFVASTGSVTDETHDALAAHYDDGTIVGIAMLAAYYVFIYQVASALALELDDEFVGWHLENYSA